MEREYTIGALLVLVTIFVIALIVYFTVPGFSESVTQIADEVFGVSVKALQEETEKTRRQEAISTFESLKNCIKQLKEKKDVCTCFLGNNYLPDRYYIQTSIDGNSMILENENIRISEAEGLPIGEIEFCTLGKGLIRNPLPAFRIQQVKGKLVVNDKKLVDNAPVLYNLKEGDKIYTCFITEDLTEEDIVKVRELSDCSTGSVVTKDNMLNLFNYFVARYEHCKSLKTKNNCLCDPFNFKELLDGYEIVVEQKTLKKETTFSLQYTKNGGSEIVDKVKGVKTVANNIFGFDGVKFIQKTGDPLPLEYTELKQGEKKGLKKWQLETETEAVFWKYIPFIFKRDEEKVTLVARAKPLEDFDKCAAEYTPPPKNCEVRDTSIMLKRLRGEDPRYLCSGKPCKTLITEFVTDPQMRLLVAAVAATESSFNERAGRGKDDHGVIMDRGLMQFNLVTAKGYPARNTWACKKDSCFLCAVNGCIKGDWRTNPQLAIPAAAQLLTEYSQPFKSYSDQELFTLAAYNTGTGVIKKAIEITEAKKKEPTWENVKDEITVSLFRSLDLNNEKNWNQAKVDIIKCYPYKVETYKKAFESEFISA